jgi:hypothetical protein
MNEKGQVVRNKAILVRKGYAQIEGLDFDETFTLVARHFLSMLVIKGLKFIKWMSSRHF